MVGVISDVRFSPKKGIKHSNAGFYFANGHET
ncbi:hypothetical protein Ct9H90mP29_07720 [bacterium]|nr:MAG: hypothetical protein Ct9H90mP29_07720 [bacterium]